MIAVYKNLSESIVKSKILQPTGNLGLYPRKDDLELATPFDLVNKLVDGEDPDNRRPQTLEGLLITVNIQQPSNNLRRTHRVHTHCLYIDTT